MSDKNHSENNHNSQQDKKPSPPPAPKPDEFATQRVFVGDSAESIIRKGKK